MRKAGTAARREMDSSLACRNCGKKANWPAGNVAKKLIGKKDETNGWLLSGIHKLPKSAQGGGQLIACSSSLQTYGSRQRGGSSQAEQRRLCQRHQRPSTAAPCMQGWQSMCTRPHKANSAAASNRT